MKIHFLGEKIDKSIENLTLLNGSLVPSSFPGFLPGKYGEDAD
jgi:hypothetical protein